MTTVKLSYSIIDAVMRGDYEGATSMYRGGSIPLTPAIELGRLKDQIWSDHAFKTQTLPAELGGAKLEGAVLVQQKYEKLIPLSANMQILLRGKPDLVNLPAIRDFKCGQTGAAAYLDTWQMDCYKLLIPAAEVGFYDCFNPYTETYSLGIKYLSRANAELALANILTFGGQFIEYLISQKALVNYK